MKKLAIAASVVICLGALLAAGLAAQNESRAPAATPAGWQHLALPHDTHQGVGTPELSRQINQLGRDGWQLVDVEGIVEDGTTVRTVYFFKRAL